MTSSKFRPTATRRSRVAEIATQAPGSTPAVSFSMSSAGSERWSSSGGMVVKLYVDAYPTELRSELCVWHGPKLSGPRGHASSDAVYIKSRGKLDHYHASLPVERFVEAGERLRCSRGRSFTRRAIPIEFPVLSRVVVGRVADRSLEKGISHTRCAGRLKTAAVYVLVTTRIAVESATAYQERR